MAATFGNYSSTDEEKENNNEKLFSIKMEYFFNDSDDWTKDIKEENIAFLFSTRIRPPFPTTMTTVNHAFPICVVAPLGRLPSALFLLLFTPSLSSAKTPSWIGKKGLFLLGLSNNRIIEGKGENI